MIVNWDRSPERFKASQEAFAGVDINFSREKYMALRKDLEERLKDLEERLRPPMVPESSIEVMHTDSSDEADKA